MTETFVDLTYRGLPLGRRIKLTRVRPTNGYLEHPTPMPVGTAISFSTDDGMTFDAVVEAIHEQVGGSAQAPGMRVKPVFATDQLKTWWTSRAEPEPEPAPVAAAPERAKPVTVRPRTQTVPEPMPAAASSAQPSITPATELADTPHAPTPAVQFPVHTIPGTMQVPPGMTPPTGTPKTGKATTVMNAVDQDTLAQLTKDDSVEQLTRRTGEHEVVDDGLRTTVMDAVDPAALGLDVSMLSSESGPMEAVDDDEPSPAESGPNREIDAQGDKKKPAKKRKKKR